MKIPQMIAAEFRRLTATRLGIVALIALLLVPVLYGGLYLWANQDPYANLDQIPVALVVSDTGTTVDDKAKNYGDEIADELLDDDSFDWHLVSAAQAAAGVDDSTYDFSVTLPADFSEGLASASGTDPRQAEVILTTNDANSYLSTTIGEQAVKTLRASIVENVNREAASTFLVGLSDIRTKLVDARDGAQKLLDGANTASSGADDLAAGNKKLADGAETLAAGTKTLSDGADTLASGTKTLAAGASDVSDGADSVASGTAQVAAGNKELADRADAAADAADKALTELPAAREQIIAALKDAGLDDATIAAANAQLDDLDDLLVSGNDDVQDVVDQVDALSDGAAKVSAGAAVVAAGANKVASGAADAASGSAKLADGASDAADGAKDLSDGADDAAAGSTKLASGLDDITDGLTELHDGLADGVEQIPVTTEASRAKQADTIADPVNVKNEAVTAAGTYGAGLAPFFASLAAWIGIYALFLIVKPVSRRAITALHSPLRVTLAGWLTPGILGGVQMAALFVILSSVLGFTMNSPLGVFGVMLMASLTFAAMILALNVWLGSVGQFLGLVLMVLQLVTAGGTFPWQTLPGPLAFLHHVLPMSAAVDAMRQLMYGGNLTGAATDIGTLVTWLLGSLILAAIGVTRMTHFRTLRDLQPSLIG